ncbi:MAG: hypothetical protein H6708_08875 [Kofleriaceae bacterium]|nr:transglutaminase family protein [Myxococcales bacterium]MCB9560511.1 hypothetical protein [Kofleriaceae bacterium]
MVDDCMRRFATAVQRPEPALELDVAALLLGEWDYGTIDLPHYRAVLDGMADSARRVRDDQADRTFAGARAITQVLFTDLGFRGNTDDYYDPRNSFLHEVIDRRVGIPITLCILYMETARRIGETVTGVGFPGHFLVRAHDGDRAVVIDPYNGGSVLSRGDLDELIKRVNGPDATLEAAVLAPVSKQQILTRMLVNLAGIYGKRGDLFRSLEVLERLYLLDAANDRIGRELDNLRKRVDALN